MMQPAMLRIISALFSGLAFGAEPVPPDTGLAFGAEPVPSDTGISRLSDKPMDGLPKSSIFHSPKHRGRSHKRMAPDQRLSALLQAKFDAVDHTSENTTKSINATHDMGSVYTGDKCEDFYDVYTPEGKTLEYKGETAAMSGCCFAMTVRKGADGKYRCKPSNKPPHVDICKCPGGSPDCAFEAKLDEECKGKPLSENCDHFYDQYEPKKRNGSEHPDITFQGHTLSPVGCCFQLEHRGGMCKPDKNKGPCKCPEGAPTCLFEKKISNLPACTGEDMTPNKPPGFAPSPKGGGGGKKEEEGDEDEKPDESHAERASVFGMVAVLSAVYEAV